MQQREITAAQARELRHARVRRYIAAHYARGTVVERDGTVILTNEFSGEIKRCR